MNQLTNPTCRECGGKCKESKAFKPSGVLSLNGYQGVSFQDATNGLIDCYKCENCGHSFTIGTDAEFSEFCELTYQLNQFSAKSETAKIKAQKWQNLRFSERNADFIKKQILSKLAVIYKLNSNNASDLELTETITNETAHAPNKLAQFNNIKIRLENHFDLEREAQQLESALKSQPIVRPTDHDQQ